MINAVATTVRLLSFLSRLLLLALVGSLFAACNFGVPEEYYEKEFDRLVKESPRWRAIYEKCDGIPKPDDFKLVGKRLGNSRVLISLGYKSGFDQSDVFEFFDARLKSSGWTLEENGKGLNSTWKKYRNANVTVAVSHGYFANGGNVGIECISEE